MNTGLAIPNRQLVEVLLVGQGPKIGQGYANHRAQLVNSLPPDGPPGACMLAIDTAELVGQAVNMPNVRGFAKGWVLDVDTKSRVLHAVFLTGGAPLRATC